LRKAGFVESLVLPDRDDIRRISSAGEVSHLSDPLDFLISQ